jgi:AraC-like DNA-binding protein
MITHFQPIYPVSPLLKDHIYCYYTVQSDQEDFRSAHYSFPHTYNAVSLYCGAAFSNANGQLKIVGDNSDTLTCVLQGKRQHPLLVTMAGAFSRLTILFKPLGLNHFMDQNLSDIIGSEPDLFTAWDLPANLFEAASPIDQLETFLCGIYRLFDQPALQQALALLSDFEQERSVKEIAAAVGLPLRTFQRLFKTHLGVSPITHQRIARFRHSLENKLFHDKFKNLTEIGYESNFYDQSYFIKLYNQLAGSNPGTLFSKLEQLGNSKLVFEFIG